MISSWKNAENQVRNKPEVSVCSCCWNYLWHKSKNPWLWSATTKNQLVYLCHCSTQSLSSWNPMGLWLHLRVLIRLHNDGLAIKYLLLILCLRRMRTIVAMLAWEMGRLNNSFEFKKWQNSISVTRFPDIYLIQLSRRWRPRGTNNFH